MAQYQIEYLEKHMFAGLDNHLWLIDTGAPTSFCEIGNLTFGDRKWKGVPREFQGLTIESLRTDIPVPFVGLLGMDRLGCFDIIFDLSSGTMTASIELLDFKGHNVPIDIDLGDERRRVPVTNVQYNKQDFRSVVDTGAMITYLVGANLDGYQDEGLHKDFYPNIGRFDVQTHRVPIGLAGREFSMRCANPPEDFAGMLEASKLLGIIGNEIFLGREVGLFASRRQLILGPTAD